MTCAGLAHALPVDVPAPRRATPCTSRAATNAKNAQPSDVVVRSRVNAGRGDRDRHAEQAGRASLSEDLHRDVAVVRVVGADRRAEDRRRLRGRDAAHVGPEDADRDPQHARACRGVEPGTARSSTRCRPTRDSRRTVYGTPSTDSVRSTRPSGSEMKRRLADLVHLLAGEVGGDAAVPVVPGEVEAAVDREGEAAGEDGEDADRDDELDHRQAALVPPGSPARFAPGIPRAVISDCFLLAARPLSAASDPPFLSRSLGERALRRV